MHVFIDDSGCGGFKFDKNSTTHLVMAACVFRDPLEIEKLAEAVTGFRQRNRRDREIKYSHTSEGLRTKFFEAVDDVDYKARVLIIDKREIWSEKLRSSPAALKSYAVRMLLTKNYGYIRDAKVVVDGQDTKAFGITDSDYLMRMVNRDSPKTISAVTFADSKENVGIQLADMVAGASRRAVCATREKDSLHLSMFRERTYQPQGTFWRFR